MIDTDVLRCFYPDDFQRRAPHYLSRGPRSRAEFDAAHQFILGHFTSSNFLERILTDGLVPDTYKKRAVDDNLPSDTNSVYLLTTFDRFYANRAVKHHGGHAIIIEVLVERRRLSADEGQISAFVLPTVDSEEALYLSMCGGACKHHGVIVIENILSIHDMYGRESYGRNRMTNG